jgi:hypothetical protein
MSVVDYLTLALWIVAGILYSILFFGFGWGLADVMDSLRSRDSFPATIPPSTSPIRGSRDMRDMYRLLDQPRSDMAVASPEIRGVCYKGDRGVIFQAATIHRFPPGFRLRGGYIYASPNPFDSPRSQVVGGVSFHPRPGAILPGR